MSCEKGKSKDNSTSGILGSEIQNSKYRFSMMRNHTTLGNVEEPESNRVSTRIKSLSERNTIEEALKTHMLFL